ncbi:MAG: hypothetical protein WD379_09360 [Dehalococcoidia bacterium]
MHVKATMRPVPREDLTEHEVKRCRAIARGNAWEVWEEHVLWWGPDPQRQMPLQEDIVPRRRRWLIIELEDGLVPGFVWEVGDDFDLPAPPRLSEVRARVDSGFLD